MKFTYKSLTDGVLRPVIPIEVGYGEKVIRYFALIDSGADMNLFHGEIADLLGIRLESGLKGEVSGITEGESQIFYTHPITIKIGNDTYKSEAAFMPTLSRNGHGLLGQSGFFNLFTVTFDRSKKEIELS